LSHLRQFPLHVVNRFKTVDRQAILASRDVNAFLRLLFLMNLLDMTSRDCRQTFHLRAYLVGGLGKETTMLPLFSESSSSPPSESPSHRYEKGAEERVVGSGNDTVICTALCTASAALLY